MRRKFSDVPQMWFILGGYTGELQVLDNGINRPFKAHVRNKYERFVVSNTTAKKRTRLDIAE